MATLCEWRLAGLKIRVGALTNENYVPGEITANFLERGFSLKQRIGAPRCGGA